MNKRNQPPKEPSSRRHYNGLVAGSVALVLAANAQVASAVATPEKAPVPTATAQVNAEANKAVGTLAAQFLQLTQSRSTSITYTHYNDPSGSEATINVFVGARPNPADNLPTGYRLSVTAPTNPAGQLQPQRTQTLAIAEGETTQPNTITTPYESVSFSRGTKNSGWLFEAEYNEDTTTFSGLTASTEPIAQETQLTSTRLGLAVDQTYEIMTAADSEAVATVLGPAFPLAPGTSPVPIKG